MKNCENSVRGQRILYNQRHNTCWFERKKKIAVECQKCVHDIVFLESGELPNENCMPKGIHLNIIDTDQINIFIVNLNICWHHIFTLFFFSILQLITWNFESTTSLKTSSPGYDDMHHEIIKQISCIHCQTFRAHY